MDASIPVTLKKKSALRTLLSQWELMLMSIPLLLYKILFSYVPLTGWATAFMDFKVRPPNPDLGMFSQLYEQLFSHKWIGFQKFEFLLKSEHFRRVVRNTVSQSFLTLVLGFVCAITLALLMNEIRSLGFKRVFQNISYLPHFLSWIIVVGLVGDALAVENGIINEILLTLKLVNEPIFFLGDPNKFWGIVAFSHLWKSLGWNTIIYMAAITAIDTTLYEAAGIDGANRYGKMWHITLPGIRPTIIILLIMNIGYLMQAGFEIQYFLGTGPTVEMAETIDIYVLKYGLRGGDFALGTAAGIFKSVISITLIAIANFLAGRFGEEKLI